MCIKLLLILFLLLFISCSKIKNNEVVIVELYKLIKE